MKNHRGKGGEEGGTAQQYMGGEERERERERESTIGAHLLLDLHIQFLRRRIERCTIGAIVRGERRGGYLFAAAAPDLGVGKDQASRDADIQAYKIHIRKDVIAAEEPGHRNVCNENVLAAADDGGGERGVGLRAKCVGVV